MQLLLSNAFIPYFGFSTGGKNISLLAALATTDSNTLVLAAVLLSLVVIYITSKIGGEFSNQLGLPPVLGELVGGVVVGISALHLLVFPAGGGNISNSLVAILLQSTAGLSPETADAIFQVQSEVLTVLAELGAIVLLFEIGLESNLRELLAVGPQAAIVAIVGVATPFGAAR